MVNYKLALKNKNYYKEIDLSSIVDKSKNIENLDKFTCNFNTEEELKSYLVKLGFITLEEANYKLCIIYNYKKEIKKLSLVYKDIVDYLDIATLLYKLKEKSRDSIFLEKLANHYAAGSPKYNRQLQNISDIRHYLYDVKSNGGIHFESRLLDEALNDLYFEAVGRPDKQTGELKINYRGLRDLARFIRKYDSEQLKKDILSTKEDTQKIEYEQTTLYGFNTKEEIEDDVDVIGLGFVDPQEPDFAPNSYEEEMYQRYIDELNENSLLEASSDIEERISRNK